MGDLQKRITDAAQRTWQAIGPDVLHAAEADSLPRDEVVECVMDFIEEHGNDPEAMAEYKKLGFEEKQAMLLNAFSLERYGW